MYDKKDKNSIKNLFDNISNNYDLINNLMSFSLHKKIKSSAVNNLPIGKNLKILDLCTGTGDIAILLSKKYPDSQIIAADFSEKMLEIASKKTKNMPNITLKHNDITNTTFEENNFDICFISFGLRNLPDFDAAISTINKILKPNGLISILDLGKPHGIIRPLFDFYFNNIVPRIGELAHNNITPYKYLVESVKNYPCQEEILKILEKNGFKNAKNIDYLSGIIAQQIAPKKTTY